MLQKRFKPGYILNHTFLKLLDKAKDILGGEVLLKIQICGYDGSISSTAGCIGEVNWRSNENQQSTTELQSMVLQTISAVKWNAASWHFWITWTWWYKKMKYILLENIGYFLLEPPYACIESLLCNSNDCQHWWLSLYCQIGVIISWFPGAQVYGSGWC